MDFDDPEMAEALLEEMEEKEEQLRLAAEFGQTLLEKTEELQEENEAMEREKEAAVAEAEEAEYRARELQDALDRLSEEASERDAALEAARAEVERKEAEIEEKLRSMSGTDEEMEAAKAQAEAEVAAAQAQAAADVKRLEEQAEAARQQQEETARARKEEEAKRIEAQEHKKDAEAKLKRKEEEMAKADAARKEMEQKMEAERLKAEQQAAEMQRKMQEMQQMERQMQEMQRQLAMANEMAAQKAAAGAPSSIDLDGVHLGESLGGSLFDDLGLAEGVPPEAKSPTNSMTPRSLDAIKEQAELEAKSKAEAHAKELMKKEQDKLRAEYEAKLAAAQETQAQGGKAVDEAAIKAEMEAKYKAEQEKTMQQAREEFAKATEAEMQLKMDQMRAESAKEMQRQMAAAQRQKEYEMHVKQISKAMGVKSKDSKEALEMLKQVNVEMLEASAELKKKAEALVSEDVLADAKAKIAASGKAGEKLDAAQLAKAMSGMTASAFDNFGKLSEEEKAEMLANLSTVKAGAVRAGSSSERVRRGSEMVHQALQKQLSHDPELSALMEEGSAMAGSSKSPAEIIDSLKDNAAFVANVKKLVCEYVTEAVTAADIPTIDGNKKWGTYQISDLSIATIAIDPSNLDLAVEQSVTIKVSGLGAEFEMFKWQLDKTSGIPKVKDQGTGQATMVNFSVQVQFDIVSDDTTGVGVKFQPPILELERLDVKVNDCKHEWIFNKMLKWFQQTVMEAVLMEVRLQAADKVDALAEKVSILVNQLF